MTATSPDPTPPPPTSSRGPAREWLAALCGGAACFALAPVPLADVALAPFALATTTSFDVLHAVMVIVLLVLSVSAHEAAHAWAALKCGDSTGRDLGRLTLNPIPHIDPWMTILMPAVLLLATAGQFAFGGAKPVPVLFHRLRHPWRDMSLVAMAGPLTNLLLGVLFIFTWHLLVSYGWYNGAAATEALRKQDLLPQVIFKAIELNVFLFVFNLVPIPPLDGSRVMAWLLPSNLRENYVALERWGMMIVLALVLLSRPFNKMLFDAAWTIIGWLETLLRLLHVIPQ